MEFRKERNKDGDWKNTVEGYASGILTENALLLTFRLDLFKRKKEVFDISCAMSPRAF